METVIVKGVRPDSLTPRQVGRAFQTLLDDGAVLRVDGDARDDADWWHARPYRPRHRVSLFDIEYYLAGYRRDDDLNFFVGYVASRPGERVIRLHARIFYKDSSLVWRVATHVIRTPDENWIGKGDVKIEKRPDGEYLTSAEETANLPYEVQGAFDDISRESSPSVYDAKAVPLILRNAPSNRLRPFDDFTRPRRRAHAEYQINRGRPIARCLRPDDPSSIEFAPGFAPDFNSGVLESTRSGSKLYGGKVRKFRILSVNRLVQYQFVATPTHVWIDHPQTITTEVMSYGVRTVDVLAAEEITIPGFEFHYLDETEDPPEWHSQIPVGFAGEPSELDPARADASPWIERMQTIREFRRKVLKQNRRKAPPRP
ncbi:MAG: hypothetical protein CMJ83_03250 [Planctomycetes bacterium]|nr:hypothetical protein [Planctomycetota bacterium]